MPVLFALFASFIFISFFSFVKIFVFCWQFFRVVFNILSSAVLPIYRIHSSLYLLVQSLMCGMFKYLLRFSPLGLSSNIHSAMQSKIFNNSLVSTVSGLVSAVNVILCHINNWYTFTLASFTSFLFFQIPKSLIETVTILLVFVSCFVTSAVISPWMNINLVYSQHLLYCSSIHNILYVSVLCDIVIYLVLLEFIC